MKSKEKNAPKREYMPFFRSFYEAISDLTDEAAQLSLYKAIVMFGLDGIEPTDLTGIAATMWKLIRPNVANSRTQFENGAKGGAPKGNKNAQRERTIPAPTATELADFCQRQNIDIDEERFLQYYSERHWQTENYKIKTWQDAAKQWEQTKNRNGYSG